MRMIQPQLEKVLKRVAKKLEQRPWQTVYLVPFGPSVLAMQIKLLVYRILHIETIDVMHIGDQRYADIAIKQRQIKSLVGSAVAKRTKARSKT